MGLPHLDRAELSPAKLRDYLLDPEHPVGWAKARFFAGLGFRRDRWAELHFALLLHAAEGEATMEPVGRYGQKVVIRGRIRGPEGATAALRAVRIQPHGDVGPRFVTAYPEERS